MAWLGKWFSSKSAKTSTFGASGTPSTVPYMPVSRRQVSAAPTTRVVSKEKSSASRKAIRMQRREQLYNIIREALVKAGVLSSHYKFKVLSTDQMGKRYLVMVDVMARAGDLVPRATEIEDLIVQHAKIRHELTVLAVYWRFEANPAPLAGADRPFAAVAAAVDSTATNFKNPVDFDVSEFEDTEILDADNRLQTLSATQPGDLQ